MSRYLIDWKPARKPAQIGYSVGGALIAIGLWEALGQAAVFGTRLPGPSSIVIGLTEGTTPMVIGRAVAATLPQAGLALIFGVSLGVVGALLQLLIPRSRDSVHRVASLLNALPAVILSPILVTMFGVAQVPVVVGTLGVFFAIFVTTSSGFFHAPSGSIDYMRSAGASRWAQFRHVQGPSALPWFADGLRLAGPSALLGTMFGEWFGSSTGLGVLIQVAWQRFQVPLLWSSALVATVIAILVLIVFGAISRATNRRFA